MEGAGGVGGLLAVNTGSATYAPTFDGNGNNIGLVNMTTGTLDAEFDYDPFGNVVKITGGAMTACPFGFSTRYTDSETGIVMYPRRPYYPPTGRFLSRDPAEEVAGGPNLYAMVTNDAVNRIDALGLWETEVHHSIVDGWLKDDKYGHYKWRCCNIDVREFIKEGSDYVDGAGDCVMLFPSAQGSAMAFMHGMRSPGQSVAAATAQYNHFIQEQLRQAREIAEAGRKIGDCTSIRFALTHIGQAFHPISDSYSPAHSGFQVWYGPVDGVLAFGLQGYYGYVMSHKAQETSAAYSQMKSAVDSGVGAQLQAALDDILKE